MSSPNRVPSALTHGGHRDKQHVMQCTTAVATTANRSCRNSNQGRHLHHVTDPATRGSDSVDDPPDLPSRATSAIMAGEAAPRRSPAWDLRALPKLPHGCCPMGSSGLPAGPSNGGRGEGGGGRTTEADVQCPPKSPRRRRRGGKLQGIVLRV